MLDQLTLVSDQFSANFYRILAEKRRQPIYSFCELFSHLFIVIIITMAFWNADIRIFPPKKYDTIQLSIPPSFLKTDSSIKDVIQTYEQVMSGPLFIPDFDQYLLIGDGLRPYVKKYHHEFSLSSGGKALSILVDPGPLLLAPAGPLVDDFLNFMNSTYVEFVRMEIFLFRNDHDAISWIQRNSKEISVFAFISFFSEASVASSGSISDSHSVTYKIRQIYDAVPSTNSMISDTFSGFLPDFRNYFVSGYLTLQKSIFLWLQTSYYPSEKSCAASSVDNLNIAFIPFPTFRNSLNSFYLTIGLFLPFLLVFSFLFPLTKFCKSLIEEKQSKLLFLMKIMGNKEEMYFVSWFCYEFLLFFWISWSVTIFVFCTFWSKSSFFLLFSLFFSFSLSLITFSLFLSSLISSSSIITIVIPILLFLFLLPFYILSSTSNDELVASKILFSLFSPSAFAFGANLISNYEIANVGLHYENVLLQPGYYYFHSLYMLWVDSVLYCLLFILVRTVNWRDFRGLLSGLLCRRPRQKAEHAAAAAAVDVLSSSSSVSSDLSTEEVDKSSSFEEVPPELSSNRKIFLEHVTKEYHNGVTAVNDLSLSFLENEIFCLLGSNGAGKSTLISLLTGLNYPTTGKITVYNHQIPQEIHLLRKQLGVCLQEDVLFPYLSVYNHLQFFGRIKGLKGAGLIASISSILMDVGLAEKYDIVSKALSGGMKRKLCLAIALIGDPKFVVLDEPTSGMDVVSRRAILDLLLRHKHGRTILLTTHFMDEADTLADRIAIMSEGNLLAVGSSFFLKKTFGCGYILSLTKTSDTPVQMIETELKEMIPGVKITSTDASEVVVNLPCYSCNSYSSVISMLKSKRNTFGIVSFGLKYSSLEQVFLSLLRSQPNRISSGHHSPSIASSSLVVSSVIRIRQPAVCSWLSHCFLLTSQQFVQMFYRRYILFVRDKYAALFQLILPIVMIVFCFLLLILQIYPLQRSLRLYSDSVYHYTGITPKIVIPSITTAAISSTPSIFTSIFSPSTHLSLIQADCNNATALSNYLADSSVYQRNRYGGMILNDSLLVNVTVDWRWLNSHSVVREKFLPFLSGPAAVPSSSVSFSPSVSSDSSESPQVFQTTLLVPFSIFHNTTCYHCAVLFYNQLLSFQLRQCRSGQSLAETDYQLNAYNHPLPPSNEMNFHSQMVLSLATSLFLTIPFSVIPSSFVAFLVLERTRGIKHQLSLASLSSVVYWISSFLFDFVIFLFHFVICLFVILLVGSPAKDIFLTDTDSLTAFLYLFLLYGVCSIFLSYVLSLTFFSPSTATISILIFHLVTGFGFLLLYSSFLSMTSTVQLSYSLGVVFRIFPSFNLGEGLLNICTTYATNSVFEESTSYLNWEVTGRNITYLLFEAPLLLLILLLTDSNKKRGSILLPFLFRLLDWFSADELQTTASMNENEDEDVALEKAFVADLELNIAHVNEMPFPLILLNLKKSYLQQFQRFEAIKGISLAFREGERFGLLGINGAGKTTTLGILTGEMTCSAGQVVLAGKPICESSIRRMIG
jgi:ATP-binding cassette subfamily A (ABC1) protein 3